jgi:DNA-binding IclR family transcriptional regulator
MAHTYEELKGMTVAQLREIASGVEHEAVQGYTQLNKEHLLAALCKAFNITMHEHKVVIGVNKTAIKSQISQLKKKRDEALATHDHTQLKAVRREIHELKRKLHRAAVLAAR